jgi:hypothetical protein
MRAYLFDLSFQVVVYCTIAHLFGWLVRQCVEGFFYHRIGSAPPIH